MIEAKTIADSMSVDGIRLTTMQLKYHRFIHSEVLTHRVFSRNASSSRAIPVSKMIEQVRNDPAIPIYWGKNQAGMQAKEELEDGDKEYSMFLWGNSVDIACNIAKDMAKIGAHKQIVNRILEPYQWMHVVVTATEWENFFALRDHPDAQPEIQELAKAMRKAMDESKPTYLRFGEWHLPYITNDDRESLLLDQMKKVSAARCARISYLKHDNTSPSLDDDLCLFERLVGGEPMHAPPLEHQATPLEHRRWCRNFRGWQQFRDEWEYFNK